MNSTSVQCHCSTSVFSCNVLIYNCIRSSAIIFGSDGNPLQKLKVNTCIPSMRTFPCKFRIRKRTDTVSVLAVLADNSLMGKNKIRADALDSISLNTIRRSHSELIKPLDILHPFLLSHIPRYGKRVKRIETLVHILTESVGHIVSDTCIEYVTVSERI